jgi:hypothetical protein
LRSEGKAALPNKAYDDFETTLNALKGKVPMNRGSNGNGDFDKVEFTYDGEKYRLCIGRRRL